MLKTCFILTLILCLAIPVVLYSALPSKMTSEPDPWSEHEVNQFFFACQKEDRELAALYLELYPTSKKYDGSEFLCSFMPDEYAARLKQQPAKTSEYLFKDMFDVLSYFRARRPHLPIEELWRVTTRAMNGNLFLQALDISLQHESPEGLKACLELPGYDYFLKRAPGGSPLRSFLLAYREEWVNPDGGYHSRPWLMRNHGEDIIQRLAAVPESPFKKDLLRLLNQSFPHISHKHTGIWPWLPIAYFSAHPDELRCYYLGNYLPRSASNNKPCPYLLNAAALFMHTAKLGRVIHFMENLLYFGNVARECSLTEDRLDQAGLLYWVLYSAVKVFRTPEEVEVLLCTDDPRDGKPEGLEWLERMWGDGPRAHGGTFYEYAQGLMKYNPNGKDMAHPTEITCILETQGHCFMELRDIKNPKR